MFVRFFFGPELGTLRNPIILLYVALGRVPITPNILWDYVYLGDDTGVCEKTTVATYSGT